MNRPLTVRRSGGADPADLRRRGPAGRTRTVAAVLLVAALAVPVLGGCRDAGTSTDTSAGTSAVPADPLAGIESTLRAVEQELDADAGG